MSDTDKTKIKPKKQPLPVTSKDPHPYSEKAQERHEVALISYQTKRVGSMNQALHGGNGDEGD